MPFNCPRGPVSNNHLASQPSKHSPGPAYQPLPLSPHIPPYHPKEKKQTSKPPRFHSYHRSLIARGSEFRPRVCLMLCHQDRYAGPSMSGAQVLAGTIPTLPETEISGPSPSPKACVRWKCSGSRHGGGGEVPLCRCLCHDGVGGGIALWVGQGRSKKIE